MLSVLQVNSLDLIPWTDGRLLPELYWKINNFIADDCSIKTQLLLAVETILINVIQVSNPVEDLIPIIDAVNEHLTLGEVIHVKEVIDSAVNYEFTETWHAISNFNTEGELTEYIDFLTSLAKISGHCPEEAKSVVQRRIADLEELERHEIGATLPSSKSHIDDKFSDNELKSLFYNLIK
ncbi:MULTISPECIES: hypothetical protein [Pseudidiomarina]|uniref:Uncharacterized protein n=2 Tax=Pseudidiomarina TaxID=2800384 RepID=A0A368V624_9GAMM|nr:MULTISPECIES: hypothetical protein [Pseudidiomarina]PWW16205.1 hypothetical protein DET45_101313 [Pseudidiomarina maritima]RBP93285.1 hypothetical protein DFO81_1011 [Pseudidiomarina tainanensis]RCW35745.1 hypothetical protein DFO79_1011 [Pseudidiomarina tainanensis]